MLVKLPLKNSEDCAILDGKVYDFISKHPYLKKIEFLANLRMHSSGYPFFQKNWRQLNGSYRNETIYLHKIIAEKFIPKPDELNKNKKLWIKFINGNPLDCKLSNLEWSTLSSVVRNTSKTKNKLGYRGVVQVGRKFHAIIYFNRQAIHLGKYKNLEEAAEAYNKKSLELFGKTRSLNKIKNKKGAK